MIPKTLHYCWFGGAPLPDLAEHCIATWRLWCPDYQLILWDEANFDVASTRYTEEAHGNGMYSKVSNYVRAFALASSGGIYLDIDVELRGGLDRYLRHDAFSGFESPGFPFTALWGAEAGHEWPRRVLEKYDRGLMDPEPTNTVIVSELLSDEFGINRWSDRRQEGRAGVVIYPSTQFALDIPENSACHLFSGTWLPANDGSFRDQTQRAYHLRQLTSADGNDQDWRLLRDILRAWGLRRTLSAVSSLLLVGARRAMNSSPTQRRE